MEIIHENMNFNRSIKLPIGKERDRFDTESNIT